MFPELWLTLFLFYCRSSLFLCRYQWSLSKRKNLHWNVTHEVENKLIRRRKGKTHLTHFGRMQFFNLHFFFLPFSEISRLSPLEDFFFFGRVELLSKDSRASCHEDPLTRGRFALSFWARISMKSELCPLSASNRKLSIIKWASHKCDIKTSENKKLHYNASSSSISISLTKNWKWRQCNIGFNFLHCHVTLNLLSIIFFKVWRSFSSV